MHPGNPNDPRVGTQSMTDPLDYRFLRDGVNPIEKGDLPDRCPRSMSRQTYRLMMRVKVMLRRKDLLTGSKWQAVVDQGEPHGGAACQGNLHRFPPNVPRDGLPDLSRQLFMFSTKHATGDD